jgi:NAD(P)-dependent dehydrogenase (short-subunit alcohol dehydrogenase family)
LKLNGRVAVVTGAGRNIGEAVADLFVREGARVAVVDNDESRALRTVRTLNAVRLDAAMPVVCDVSSSASVQAMVAQVVDRFGGVDVLVNNAAVTDRKNILELEEDEWDRVVDVSLKGVFLCSKYVARRMVDQGRGGAIVNVASTSGHRGRPDATAYTAAKAGVLNLTRSLAFQLAPHHIRVNSVTPNKVGSPVGEEERRVGGSVRNLVGRNGEPVDVAQAALFLVSDDAGFINGADILVDGGALVAAGV